MKRLILEFYWMLTRAYLRYRGAEVGRGVKCNGFPYVRVRKSGRLIIGDGVQINATPWSNAHVIRGSTNLFVAENAILEIEAGAGISGSRIIAIREIRIGAGALVGSGCMICDSDMHELPLGSTGQPKVSSIRIENYAFIGAQSIILKGVTIGEFAVVGAGSVVAKSIPRHSMSAGSPARLIQSNDLPNST